MYPAHRPSAWVQAETLLLAFMIAACQGASTPTDSGPSPIGGYIEQFPHRIGTTWLYSVVDSRQNRTDTVTVLIEKLVGTTDTSATWRWRFESLHGNIVWPDCDVTITGNRVILRSIDDDPTRSLALEFPFRPDGYWHYEQMTSFVQDMDTLSTAFGQFVTLPVLSAWLWGCLSCNYWFVHWYVPEIGFVRIMRGEGINTLDTYQVWELLEWHPGRIPIRHTAWPME
jgi:hypothetical protein